MSLLRFALPGLLAVGSATAHADLPDCHVLLRAGSSALHPGALTVAAGTSVALEVHCNYGPADPAPAFQWSNGSTRFDTALAAGADGESRALSVEVTQGAQTRSYTATVLAAAKDTPSACTLTVDEGNVPVFGMRTVRASCPGATSYAWSSLLDFRGQGTDTVQVFDLFNVADPGIVGRIDVAGVNAAGTGAPTGTQLAFTRAAPQCRIDATPAGTVAPGTSVRFDATCDGDPGSFTWGPVASSTASMTLSRTESSEVLMVAYGQLIGNSIYSAALYGSAPPLRDYTGAWWAGAAQSGWGLTLNQHEDRLFGVIYLDDPRRLPSFVVLAGGSWDATHTAFTGALYAPESSWLGSYDATRFDPKQSVGTMTLRFADAGTLYLSATLAYGAAEPPLTALSTHIQKKLTPLLVNAGANPSGNNYGDLWWGGTRENGWGLSITQQGALTFAAWYTYDRAGRATWYVLQSDAWSGNTLTGPILRVAADPLLARDFSAARTTSTAVGTGTLSFTDAGHGTFSYTVDGVTQEKAIERLAF